LILVKTFLSANKTGVHQKTTKWNLNGHIHVQATRVCLYMNVPV